VTIQDTTTIQQTLPVLGDLARLANDAHRKAEGAAVSALEYAREAGEYLTQAKAQCKHGEWLPWLEANFEATERTARNYMTVFRRWDELTENRQRVADLSLRGALAELAPTIPNPPPMLTHEDLMRQRLHREAYDVVEDMVRNGGYIDDGEGSMARLRDLPPEERREKFEAAVIESAYERIQRQKQHIRDHYAEHDAQGHVKPEAQERREHLNVLSADDIEWYTPPEYIDAARAVMGDIDLDPASNDTAQGVIQAANYYTVATNGLAHEWLGRVWLNPPWGRACADFVEKAVKHYEAGDVEQAILLLNSNSNETEWFQPLWDHTLCFTRGRINYYTPDGEKGSGSTHGSVFVYLGPNWREFAATFAPFGNVVRKVAP